MARAHDNHSAAVGVAEAAYQASMKTAATETDRTNARITYYRAVLSSGRANGISTGAAEAIRRLGGRSGSTRGR